MGRPRKAPEDRAPKRLPMNMKASPELRAKIEAAARLSDLSMSQEVERRLIESFQHDAEHHAARELVALIRASIMHCESMSGRLFNEDPMTHAALSQAINKIVERLEPLPANFPAIRAGGEALRQVEVQFDAAVEYLESKGVWAEPVNALAALASGLSGLGEASLDYPIAPIPGAPGRKQSMFGSSGHTRYKTVLPHLVERTPDGEPRPAEEVALIKEAIGVLKETYAEAATKRDEYLAEWKRHDEEVAKGKALADAIIGGREGE